MGKFYSRSTSCILINRFADTAAILISIVSNSYYEMLRGQIHIKLPPEHPIMSFETIEIKITSASPKRTIGKMRVRQWGLVVCPYMTFWTRWCQAVWFDWQIIGQKPKISFVSPPTTNFFYSIELIQRVKLLIIICLYENGLQLVSSQNCPRHHLLFSRINR